MLDMIALNTLQEAFKVELGNDNDGTLSNISEAAIILWPKLTYPNIYV